MARYQMIGGSGIIDPAAVHQKVRMNENDAIDRAIIAELKCLQFVLAIDRRLSEYIIISGRTVEDRERQHKRIKAVVDSIVKAIESK